MAKTAILIDGAQSSNVAGTGIASYGRSLASALSESDCSVGVLFGRRVVVKRRTTDLGIATQVFGKDPPSNELRWLLRVGSLAASALKGLGTTRAVEVPLKYIDLGAMDPPLPRCEWVLNADGLFERSWQRFGLWGRFTEVKTVRSFAAAHWTGPMPIRAHGVPNIYTLHDLIPLQFPYFVTDRGGSATKLHEAIARDADLIITVSQSSKRQIMDILDVPEDRISVTYQPVPSLGRKVDVRDSRLVEGIYGVKSGEYALFVGAIEPKKNIRRLIEAFLLADIGIPLLIAGPLGWLYDEDMALIALISELDRAQGGAGTSPSNAGVRYVGYLPRRHIRALMQSARFLAFPSLYEGFGLPVLEAMELGIPVLTSNAGSLPEVAGDAAVLIDPLDVSDMANAIQQLNRDAHLRAELGRRGPAQAAKFSLTVYKQRLAAAYAKVGVALGA